MKSNDVLSYCIELCEDNDIHYQEAPGMDGPRVQFVYWLYKNSVNVVMDVDEPALRIWAKG